MIINNNLKFIFFHNPKTGGSSISKLFSLLSSYKDIELGETELGKILTPYYHKKFGLHKHGKPDDLLKVCSTSDWNSYFKFAFVRNPYSRTYSSYKFITEVWTSWDKDSILNQINTFSDFLDSELFRSDGPGRIFLPQFKWICDSNVEIVTDKIGKFENLENDLQNIISEISHRNNLKESLFGPDIVIPKINVSSKNDEWKTALSKEDKEKIYNKYIVDFEKFGYDK